MKEKKFSKQYKVNKYEQPYDRFNMSLDFLNVIKQIIPEVLKSRQKINLTKEELQQLNPEELEEYNLINKSLIEVAQNRLNRSVQIKSSKLSSMFIDKLKNALDVSMINEFTREMSLVYLITKFEQYIGETLKTTFQLKPEVMKSSEKQISYKKLFSFSNFNDLKKNIVEQEVSSIINLDINEVSKYLKKHFDLDLRKNNNWRKFTEYFYRRNILIHNEGYPNKIYRIKTGYKGKQKKLSITSYYLSSGVKLFQDYSATIKNFFTSKFISNK